MSTVIKLVGMRQGCLYREPSLVIIKHVIKTLVNSGGKVWGVCQADLLMSSCSYYHASRFVFYKNTALKAESLCY